MGRFMPNAKISQVHGQATRVNSRLVVAMYHPAAALHQNSLRPIIEADFTRLPEYIAMAENLSRQQEGGNKKDEEEPKQLRLF